MCACLLQLVHRGLFDGQDLGGKRVIDPVPGARLWLGVQGRAAQAAAARGAVPTVPRVCLQHGDGIASGSRMVSEGVVRHRNVRRP